MDIEGVSILELFSGIGGMRAAIKETKTLFNRVGSFEINPVALKIYQHNFGVDDRNKEKNVMGIDRKTFEDMRPNLLVMSPPCQPFTRQGLKKDVQDSRCSPFLHILSLLEQAAIIPEYVLMENVSGFETSEAHEKFIKVLENRSYKIQEYLLTPYQFGIPNARLRYYLLAKKSTQKVCSEVCKNGISTVLPICICFHKELQNLEEGRECQNCNININTKISTLISKKFTPLLSNYTSQKLAYPVALQDLKLELSLFLDDRMDRQDLSSYFVKEKILLKYGSVFDIVNPSGFKSCCFTKGYAHYVQGTGSVIQSNEEVNLNSVFQSIENLNINDSQYKELLLSLNLRYFTPREILKLLFFPDDFHIPNECSNKQVYKVLGNSINVFIVSVLLLLLLN